jgi:O-antigen/teichoic acid export membrane protein
MMGPSDPAQVLPRASVPPLPPSSGLGDSASQLVGRGTMIMIGSTIAFFALNFVARVVIARTISVAQWGLFNLGVSLTMFLSIVIILGLNNAVARCLVLERDPRVQHAMVRWSLWVSSIVSVVASVATYLLAVPFADVFHDAGLAPVLVLLAVSVGLGAITPVYAAIFQGFQDMIPNALFNQVLNPAVFVVAALGLLVLGWGLDGAIVAYVLADIAGFVASVYYYQRRIHRHLKPEFRNRDRPPRVLWTSTVSLWGISSLAFVTAYADTLILGAFWPALQVGYYSTAMSLARTLLLAGGALTFVFLPVAARLAREGDLRTLRISYTVAARWIMIVSIPLFLLFFLLPSESVIALFGRRYLAAAIPLQILALSAFASSIIGPSNACLAGLGQDRLQLSTAIFTGIVNVVLSFALIPTYGVLGAAISWGIARALYPASSLVFLYRDYGVHPFHRSLVRPLVLTLAIAGPVFLATAYFVPGSWVVFPLFFVGFGVFLGSLFVTRSLLPDDMVFLGVAERLFGIRLPRVRAFVTDRFAVSAAA